MKKIVFSKGFYLFLLVLLGAYTALPNFLPERYAPKEIFKLSTLNLGLDLKGGSHLLLEADLDTFFNESLETIKDNIKKELREKNIALTNVSKEASTIQISLREDLELGHLKKILNGLGYKSFNVEGSNHSFTLEFSDDFKKEKIHDVIAQSIEIVRKRIDENGTIEPIIQKQGEKYILIQVPGIENPEELKKKLGQTAKLTFNLVNHEAMAKNTIVPYGSVALPFYDLPELDDKMIVYKKPLLLGDTLKDARATFDDKNSSVVSFELNNQGAKEFASITKQHKGQMLAIVLDNKIISAPRINDHITGGAGVIKGNFDTKSANDLALLLRAGALPVPLKIVEERSVGPSLGQESINAGVKAAVIGIILVMIAMVLTYKKLGVIANLALLLNMLFLIAVLALMQATLTMPGIAGIVLTIGMSVDANVLIFERMREEARAGKPNLKVIDTGFKNAMSTIIDSNVTTIFAALSLYIFGTGPVKGFAVTLIVGVITSMFCAVTITKYLVTKWVSLQKPLKVI
jgi:preprotein translocase subunit SecD